MYDQAIDLRRLARRCASRKASAHADRPKLLLVAGGKGGAGTTTIAVNLAAAIANRGLRTVLVDADLHGGDAAILCGIEPQHTLADVLARRRTIPEVLQAGPGNARTVPGAWGLERLLDHPAALGRPLLGELDALAGEADLLLLDTGRIPNRMTQQAWQAADLLLLVTTPDISSITSSYALIKMLAEDESAVPVHLLVNKAPTPGVAEEVQHRLARTCRRFLGIRLNNAGHLPAEPQIVWAAAGGEPFITAAAGCTAARELDRLAQTLASHLAQHRSNSRKR
jgi:flagellar biosynthesis protein FlhG